MRIKVFLADDHELLINGFKSHLEHENIDVIETASTLIGLEERFKKSNAAVLILDLRFNAETQTGLDMAETILRHNPQAKIVLLSQFDDAYIIEKTYKVGVLAFVSKDDAKGLTEAIQNASQGIEYLSPAISHKLAIETIHTRDPRKLLTPQETKVFTLVADGLTPQKIADQMSLAYRTVNILIGSIRGKLGIETYPEFTKIAIKYGLISLD